MMGHIGIIADDLSGACDSGVQLTRHGLETLVLFDHCDLREVAAGAEAIVIDTDSRALPAPEAYRRVKQAAEALRVAGFTHIYKKVDSTLRGNLGAEIDAVMDVLHTEIAVVAPALPRLGRTTVGGGQLLNGVPVDRLELARDPKDRVNESDIVGLLSTQSWRRAGLVELTVLHLGLDAVLRQMAALQADGVRLLVFDAETDEDLRLIGAAASRYSTLWAGSAGLAQYLPSTLGIPVRPREQFALEPSTDPVMLVAGSVSETTRAQVGRLSLHPNVVVVRLDPVMMLEEDVRLGLELDRCRCELSAALSGGSDVVLTVGAPTQSRQQYPSVGRVHGGPELAVRVAGALGVVASDLICVHTVRGLVLTGGDTARAVCGCMGATGLRPQIEVEAGAVLSSLVGAGGLLVVTKAGGFGRPDTLLHALVALKGNV